MSALRESFTRPWSSMAMTLTWTMSPIFGDIVDAARRSRRSSSLMWQQAVLAGDEFDEGAKVLDRGDLARVVVPTLILRTRASTLARAASAPAASLWAT